MDFLKKLNINDDDNDKPSTTNHPTTHTPDSGHHSLLDKFSGALNPEDQHSTPTAPPPNPPQHDSVFDKIGDALGGHHAQPHPPVAAPAKDEGLLDKILGSHHTSPPPPPVAVPKDDGLFDKIGSALHGHGTDAGKVPVLPPPPREDQGLLGRLGEAVGHHGRGEEVKKPETLGDKISGVFGGGRKGEEEEGGLDKAIDFVQEHVLKGGQQKDESVVEQMKDKQIAAAIKTGFKNVTGKEFPEHRNKDGE
ncbi:hypothetical protein FPV67DRAFT_1586909 [Lyophyllum atratum]|nr:hypothetical protein FPV67DRAFT_1586909 [Lyophyllum atratum]